MGTELEDARKANLSEWGKWKQYYKIVKGDLSDDRKKELEEVQRAIYFQKNKLQRMVRQTSAHK